MMHMEPDPIFKTVFRKLYGKPCWNVKPGYGSFLTFEFGRPRLEVREPHDVENQVSPGVRKILAHRRISIRGDWHLWIYCCNWTAYSSSRIIGDSSTRQRIQKAAYELDGQKLLSVEISRRGSRTIFEFDLNGRLETNPYDRKSEQWMLYEPSGYVMTLRADNRFTYIPANTTPDEMDWKAIRV